MINKLLRTSGAKRYFTVQKLADILSLIYLAVLILLPFHALLTTWAGSSLGHLDAWRIWKELIIVATAPAVVYLVIRTEKLRQWARTSWLVRLIALYAALYIFSGVIALWRGNVNESAFVYALLANLRYLGFFLMVVAVASLSSLLGRYVVRAMLGSAAVVVAFGLIQLVLPYDFLKHFGYGPKTIPAYQTVDNKIAYQRIQSTLRGANPLGAYLAVVVSLLGACWARLRRYRLHMTVLLVLTLAALFFSYSRSAYVGVILGALVWLYLVVPPVWRRNVTYGLLVMGVCGVFAFLAVRNTRAVQNTLFHSDNSSTSSQSSNAGRASAMKQGLRDVLHEPLGRGPGTAGPESQRNRFAPRIAENYFLQIGQEVGWLGLVLFVLINVMIAAELWYARRSLLGMALLMSFVGLTFINMVSHAWSDDTLGLLWWGFAGVVVGSAVLDIRKTAIPPDHT
jgi:hypothetical protein